MILENKLGITNHVELAKAEERIKKNPKPDSLLIVMTSIMSEGL